MRGCLGVSLIIVGAFCVAVALGGDPCRPSDVGDFFFYVGSVILGVGAFLVIRARTRRLWIPWTVAVTTTVVVMVGGGFFALLRWVGACAN